MRALLGAHFSFLTARWCRGMAELSFSSDKAGGCPEMSHTFVIEIDRKGSQGEKHTACRCSR